MATNGTTMNNSGVIDAISTLRQDVGAIGDDVHDLASQLGKEVRHKVKTVRHAGAERAHALIAQTEDRVRDRPVAALGMAAGAGFLLGVLLATRR